MGKKGAKRKTRWRVLPIGEDGGGGSGSGNEDEGEAGSGVGVRTPSYARAAQPRSQVGGRRPPPRQFGLGKHHHPRDHQHSHQPLVTTEKRIFNEEEYTKITTPRQDVLFKKGYLGRKRPTAPAPAPAPAPGEGVDGQLTSADHVNGNLGHYDPSTLGHGEGLDNDITDMMEEPPPQFIYTTNGFVDQSGVFYINGSGYEVFDPYSGQVTVVVGPAHYGPGGGGGPPVLAAVPLQPVPLQPLEWFNPHPAHTPGFLPYVTAPQPPAGVPRDRRKRYSTDSQNCSPQSSESTGPPGSPQESDETPMGAPEGAIFPPQHPPPPPYLYPGYMFGAPMYNMNGVTVQGAPNAAPTTDPSGKRRKKKRRRRRRRNGVEDGSEESSSEDKDGDIDPDPDAEEPMSVTSQESSLESDSKLSSPPPPPPSAVQPPPPPPPAKNHAHTQTAVPEQPPPPPVPAPAPAPAPARDAATDTVDFVLPPTPVVNGVHDPPPDPVVTPGDRLVNGLEVRPTPTPTKGERRFPPGGERKPIKTRVNGHVGEKAHRPVVPAKEENAFPSLKEDGGHVHLQELLNGNVQVDFDEEEEEESEESEWITVKGHKGSQGRRHVEERRPAPPELTNGHVKVPRAATVKVNPPDKPPHKVNPPDKQAQKGGKVAVEERCTSARVRGNALQAEPPGKEKPQVNGVGGKVGPQGRLLNGTGMDGNEKEEGEGPPEAPSKPTRKERRSQLKAGGGSPAKVLETPKKPVKEAEAAPPKLASGNNGNKKKKTGGDAGGGKEPPPPAREVEPPPAEPPVAPPRRKRCHPSSKRAATPAQGDGSANSSSSSSSSTDEASTSTSATTTSSSRVSEESVIECLSSSGVNSPRAKPAASALSSSDDDDDVIYQGGDGLGRITECQEGEAPAPAAAPSGPPSEERVRAIAEELVDAVIREAMAESVKARGVSGLGLTAAVTRWLRSQSPDVLSVPTPARHSDGDDSDSEDSDEALQGDATNTAATGSKNLSGNPLPAPSAEAAEGGADADAGRRVANTISEKPTTRTVTATSPFTTDVEEEEDVLSCGEWDPWECQQPRRSEEATTLLDVADPYDPLANDTFAAVVDAAPQRRAAMCDPAASVSKYYVLGPGPGGVVEDIEGSDSEAAGLAGLPGPPAVSLAEELARLGQPLPAGWASCRCQVDAAGGGGALDSGVESGDEAGVATRRRVDPSGAFKRRLASRLRGEPTDPFPIPGGVCCLLQ